MKEIKRDVKLQVEYILLQTYTTKINGYGKKQYTFKSAERVWVCLHSVSVSDEVVYLFFQGKTKKWIDGFQFFKFRNQIYQIISSKEWHAKTGEWIDLEGKRYS